MASLVKNGNFDSPDITGYSSATLPTNWTATNSQYGILDGASANLTGLPSTILQLIVLSTTGNMSQSITFTTVGNYVLSFWTRVNADTAVPFFTNQTINVNLGTILTNSTTYTSRDDPWKQVIIPFTISSPNTTATLTFAMSNENTQVWFTGVSIVSTDYTLDLYLEWIPDEDVKKITDYVK